LVQAKLEKRAKFYSEAKKGPVRGGALTGLEEVNEKERRRTSFPLPLFIKKQLLCHI